ncbi:MAG: hypothetical protein HY717_15915 [Planctomycetes bacterium]|nr:hypothetical protein [Planctomycetota bacterium]
MIVDKFVSSYLRSENVVGDLLVTVNEVREAVLQSNGKSESKLVMVTPELALPIVLNKAMLRQLIDIFGSNEAESWKGKRVILYKDPEVYFQGRRVGGLRFKRLS